MEKLLRRKELVHRKQKQLLRQNEELIDSDLNTIGDDLLKNLFLARLPSNGKAIVVAVDNDTVE